MVQIDGERFHDDRKARWTRDSFLLALEEKTGQTISLSTLRRAEEGSASKRTFSLLCQTIGYPPLRYEVTQEPNHPAESMFDLNGEWLVFYVEDDHGVAPYVNTERLFLKQSGTNLSGIYEPESSQHPDGHLGTAAFTLTGQVIDNVVFGRYYVENRKHPCGTGVFQLAISRQGGWAEGACTFYGDTDLIAVSINIWIKKDHSGFSLMKKQVSKLLKGRRPLFTLPISNL